MFVVGCEDGSLYIRIDWEESQNSFNTGKTIFDVKFSKNDRYLVAGCDNHMVYVF